MSTNTQQIYNYLTANPRATVKELCLNFSNLQEASIRSSLHVLISAGQVIAKQGANAKTYLAATPTYDVAAVRNYYNVTNKVARTRAKARKTVAKARAAAKQAAKPVATPQQQATRLANLAKARQVRAANLAARQVISRTVRTAGATDGLEHTFRLREDLTIALNLPKDLTAAEAARIGQYVATLPLNG